jgi:hypothetical protein
MEPERKIEKWLRAYAKKRRGQAKDSFNLHPANRRLLQEEIARKTAAPEEVDDSLSLWEVLRRQWALLLTFATCVFLIGVILLPVLNTARKKAQPSLSMANLKQIGPAVQMSAAQNNGRLPASLDELTNGSLAKGELNDAEFANRRKFAEATNQDLSQAVAMNSLSSQQPESPALVEREMANAGNEPAPSIAPAPAAPMPETSPANEPPPPQPTTASSDLALNSAGATTTTTTPPVTVGGVFTPSAVREEVEVPPAGRTAQPQLGSGLQNAFQNSIAASQALPVLSNFQVQQNGSALRIVDRDGSVYVGSWRLANLATVNGIVEEQALQNSDKQSATGTPQTSAPPAVALADNVQAAQNYFFRVHGINRTLNQSVVFTGNLLANFAVSGNLQQGFGGGAANNAYYQLKIEPTNQAAQLPWSNLRIAGTAAINRTNHIEVNATPVAPAKQN